MGIAGTEVAKDASDIVLLDDNFASIETAILWGRNIYQNVRKFLQFQLTVNVVALFIVFIGSVVLRDPPLTSVQMLWVNLIMDTCGALALATEPPGPELLKQKPYPRTESIVNPVMIRNILGGAIYQMTVLLVLLFAGVEIFKLDQFTPHHVPVGSPDRDQEAPFYYKKNENEGTNLEPHWITDTNSPNLSKLTHYTMIFHSFVLMQIFNEINSRKLGERDFNVLSGFFNNGLFIFIVLITIAIQVAIVEYGGASLRTVPLSIEQHLVCVAIGLFTMIWCIFVKFIPVSLFAKVTISDEVPDEIQLAKQSSFQRLVSTRTHKSLVRDSNASLRRNYSDGSDQLAESLSRRNNNAIN